MSQLMLDVQSGVKTCHDRLINRVLHRQAPVNLDWLVSHQKIPFIPDYLTVSTIGKSKVKSLINRMFAVTAPLLWHRYILHNIHKKAIFQFRGKYISKWHNKHPQEKHTQAAKELMKAIGKIL